MTLGGELSGAIGKSGAATRMGNRRMIAGVPEGGQRLGRTLRLGQSSSTPQSGQLALAGSG